MMAVLRSWLLALALSSVACNKDSQPPAGAPPDTPSTPPPTAQRPANETPSSWLVRTADSPRAGELLAIAQKLAKEFPDQRVVKSPDGSYLLLAGPPGQRAQADATLAKVAASRSEAALLECRAQGDDPCAQWGEAVVSPTFFALDPEDMPDDDALVARELAHADAYSLRAVPYYDAEDDSPLLGMVSRVDLTVEGKSRPLADPCLMPDAQVAPAGTRVAIQCVTGQAGPELTHSVTAFELPSGKQLASVETCRDASWTKDGALLCQQEAVDAEGELSLTPHPIALP